MTFRSALSPTSTMAAATAFDANAMPLMATTADSATLGGQDCAVLLAADLSPHEQHKAPQSTSRSRMPSLVAKMMSGGEGRNAARTSFEKRTLSLSRRFRGSEQAKTCQIQREELAPSDVAIAPVAQSQSASRQPCSSPIRKSSERSMTSFVSPSAAGRRNGRRRTSLCVQTPVLSPSSSSAVSSPTSFDSPATPATPLTPTSTMDVGQAPSRLLHETLESSAITPASKLSHSGSRPPAESCLASQRHYRTVSQASRLSAALGADAPTRNEAADVMASASTTPRQNTSILPNDARPQRPLHPAPPLDLHDFVLIPDDPVVHHDEADHEVRPLFVESAKLSAATGLGLFTSHFEDKYGELTALRSPSSLQPLATIGEDMDGQTKAHTKRRSFSMAAQRFSSAAARLPSISSQESFRLSLLGAPLSRADSIESFHCCGLQEEDEVRLAIEQSKERAAALVLKAALSSRPRPWPLAQKLAQNQPRPLEWAIPPRKSSKPPKRATEKTEPDDDDCQTTIRGTPYGIAADGALELPSRFSSVSDVDNLAAYNRASRGWSQVSEEQGDGTVSCHGSATSSGSPTASWLSPTCSSVTSPRVHPQELDMSPQASSIGSPTLPKAICELGEQDAGAADNVHTFDLLPGFTRADAQRSLSLRLSLPPTFTAKHAALAGEHTISIATSASALELKEQICDELLTLHHLSVSPSQLGLLMAESCPTSPQETHQRRSFRPLLPSRARSAGSSQYHKTRSSLTHALSADCLGSSPTLGQPRRSLMRHLSFQHHRASSSMRLAHKRASSAAVLTRSTMPITSKQGVTTYSSSINEQPLDNDTAAPPSLQHQRLRMLPNCAILFEEGLQNDDTIVVRF